MIIVGCERVRNVSGVERLHCSGHNHHERLVSDKSVLSGHRVLPQRETGCDGKGH